MWNPFDFTPVRQMTSLCARSYVSHRPLPYGCGFLPPSSAYIRRFWRGPHDGAGCRAALSLCAQTGFTIVRLALSPQAYIRDAEDFYARFNDFLAAADARQISLIPVLFDDSDVNSLYQPRYTDMIKEYLQETLHRFGRDERIYCFDLLDRPGVCGQDLSSAQFLENLFTWSWEVSPSKPLTACLWRDGIEQADRLALQLSDLITFQCFSSTTALRQRIARLKMLGRPILCTGWFNRRGGMTPTAVLPMLLSEGIGFVCGPLYDSAVGDGLYAPDGVAMMNDASLRAFIESSGRESINASERRGRE